MKNMECYFVFKTVFPEYGPIEEQKNPASIQDL
jgi:hypothetical protein